MELATLWLCLAAWTAGANSTPGRTVAARSVSIREAEPSDERVHEVWAFLLPAEQEEARQWFTAEAEGLNNYTGRVIRTVLDIVERDPGSFPEAPEPRFFDPHEHAPKQPIRREWVEPDERAWKKLHKAFHAAAPARQLVRAWRYDYGTRSVVRCADDLSPDHVAANALQGFVPALDLAEALVESLLDDGSQQVALGAFEHAYTDRDGSAYRGLTLYDAWASGKEIELPDVDSLGIIHTVLDEWERWVAPVSDRQHGSLYGAIGEIFADAQRHRGLRDALTRTFAIGEPVYRDAYGPHRDRFHALWFEAGNDPRELAKGLPSSAAAAEFLGEMTMRIEKNAALIGAARERRELLEENRRQVRRLWIHILRELGAFERTQRPRPPKAEKD